MDDLVQWLHAQLDDDERTAQAAAAGPWSTRWTGQEHELVAPARAYPIAEWTYAIATQEPEASAQRAECDTANADHIARHDPERVLCEIKAKRQLLAEHAPRDGRCRVCAAHAYDSWTRFRAPCPTLRLLALPYADRPGYRDDWRP